MLAYSKFAYTFKEVNNEDADQTWKISKVIFTFVVCISLRHIFEWHGPNRLYQLLMHMFVLIKHAAF